jgi:hypothetical protein
MRNSARASKSTPETKLEVVSRTAPTSSLTDLVDDLGRTQAEIQAIENLIPTEKRARLKMLEKIENDLTAKLLAAAKIDPASEAVRSGTEYDAFIGMAENKRVIAAPNKTVARVVDEQCGKGTFLANCSITLKALERLLPEPIREILIASSRTGTRKVTTTAKAIVQKAA